MQEKKRIVQILKLAMLLCLALYGPTAMMAQSNTASSNNIFDALSSNKAGEGRVNIEQPAQVRASVGNVSSTALRLQAGESGSVRVMQGYRVQVYNGNLPSSKREANSRAAQITQFDPTMTCYLTYKAPFWRLLVGDYATREEAELTRQTLKAAFPNYAREIYIVRDKVRISL